MPSYIFLRLKHLEAGRLLVQSVGHLPSTKVMITKSWDWAPCSVENLLLPLLLPLPPTSEWALALKRPLSNKSFLKKWKFISKKKLCGKTTTYKRNFKLNKACHLFVILLVYMWRFGQMPHKRATFTLHNDIFSTIKIKGLTHLQRCTAGDIKNIFLVCPFK